jgi:hypothetical protein
MNCIVSVLRRLDHRTHHFSTGNRKLTKGTRQWSDTGEGSRRRAPSPLAPGPAAHLWWQKTKVHVRKDHLFSHTTLNLLQAGT